LESYRKLQDTGLVDEIANVMYRARWLKLVWVRHFGGQKREKKARKATSKWIALRNNRFVPFMLPARNYLRRPGPSPTKQIAGETGHSHHRYETSTGREST
jgi:hypothetical protein